MQNISQVSQISAQRRSEQNRRSSYCTKWGRDKKRLRESKTKREEREREHIKWEKRSQSTCLLVNISNESQLETAIIPYICIFHIKLAMRTYLKTIVEHVFVSGDMNISYAIWMSRSRTLLRKNVLYL